MTPHKVELRTADDVRILMRHIENDTISIGRTMHLDLGGCFSYAEAATVIRRLAAQLTHLDVHWMMRRHITPIFMALLECTNLEVLNCEFYYGHESFDIPMILKRKPMLKEINFGFEGNPDWKNLNAFLRGGDHVLEKIILSYYDQDEEDFVELFESATVCPTLKELQCGSAEQKITARGTAAIRNLIAQSRSLKFLCINPIVSLAGIRTLAEPLAANETLERLHLGFWKDPQDLDLDLSPIARALRHHNSTLEEFLIKRDESMYKKIKFYCQLNKIGRANLLSLGGENQMAPSEAWVETIISNKDNVSVVFYLLQKNPSLIKHVADEVSLCVGASEKWMDLLGKIPSNLTANQEALLAAQIEKVEAALAAYKASKNSKKVGHCEAVADVVEADNDDKVEELSFSLQVPSLQNAGSMKKWNWGPLQMPPMRFFKKKKTGGEKSSSSRIEG